MVAFNFQERFAPAVEARAKRQTIRAQARCKPGDDLQLYTGQRTAACRKLGDAICTNVFPVEISAEGMRIAGDLHYADGTVCRRCAEADGFADFAAMAAFFKDLYDGDTFEGFLIEWE